MSRSAWLALHSSGRYGYHFPSQAAPWRLRIPAQSPDPGDIYGLVVADVDAFPGHIAWGLASNAEIVVPLARERRIFGVLDIDSPRAGRFDAADRSALETIATLFVEASEALDGPDEALVPVGLLTILRRLDQRPGSACAP